MVGRQQVRSLARAHPWFAVVAATAIAVGLVEIVGAVSGTPSHRFLLWNLFLAWVPLPLAAAAYALDRLGFGLAALAPFLLAWLVFFPNAPYIVTDLIHFGDLNGRISPGLDLATLVAAAVAGLMVGFASLYVVQRLITRRYGYATSRVAVLGALALASVGVYIGRVFRWNSWEVITSPQALGPDVVTRLAHPLALPEAMLGIAAFSLLLLVSYRPALRVAGFVR